MQFLAGYKLPASREEGPSRHGMTAVAVRARISPSRCPQARLKTYLATNGVSKVFAKYLAGAQCGLCLRIVFKRGDLYPDTRAT